MAGYRGTLLKRSSLHTAQWSGGTTTEIAIGPEHSLYADRDFQWRISTATVETEESDFTSLPDYRRVILTQKGTLLLSHNEGAWKELEPYEIHIFDGADRTKSRGKVTDFNLMTRKGSCEGTVKVVKVSGNPEPLLYDVQSEDCEPDTLFFYCSRGMVLIESKEDGFSFLLQEGDCLRLDRLEEEVLLRNQERAITLTRLAASGEKCEDGVKQEAVLIAASVKEA